MVVTTRRGAWATGWLTLLLACGGLDQATGGGDGTGATDTDVAADDTTGAAPVQTSVAATEDDAGSAEGSGDDDSSSSDAPTPPPALGAPYPLVLAHGFFGFEDLADFDFADYFWELPPALASAGQLEVFTPTVDPFNDSTIRGAQLLVQVEAIIEQTGREKVVLIGHSQGGLDARVVANLRPDLVAAVVTIATPHRGSPVADVVLGLISDPNAQGLIDALVNLVGAPLWDTVDGDSSLAASMEQFSQPGILAFNATYPDAPEVRYISIAGRSSLSLGGDACAVPGAPAFISDWSAQRDPIDNLFSAPAAFLSGNPLAPIPNDGLVRVEDSIWGEFLGCVPADHVDQIGHIFGDQPGLLNAWDHKEFWVALAQWIRAQGL